MHVFVRFARVATGFTGGRARLELGLQESRIRPGLPGNKLGRRSADISAVEITADALGKVCNPVFGQAGIST
jgi:hypothetical protein